MGYKNVILNDEGRHNLILPVPDTLLARFFHMAVRAHAWI